MNIKSLVTSMATGAVVLVAASSLAGCSILYPNWNTTAKPGDSSTPSSSSSSSTGASASSTPSPTASVARKKAQIAWVDSGVDAPAGVIFGVGEITNVVEDGGTCTLTFIGAGKTKSVTGKAEVNATDTQCHPLELSMTGLPKCAGLITISYDSPTYVGTSTAVAVTIP